jgi:cytochrome c oxidase assembly factor 2
MTSSIFVTTLFASFAVVTLPHILPCPAPRVAYTEGEVCPDGKRRRRKRCAPEIATDGLVKEGQPCATAVAVGGGEDLEEIVGTRVKKECPIPKPGGTVGRILAFTGIGSNTDGSGGTRPSP